MKVEFKEGKMVIDGIETFPYWGSIKNKKYLSPDGLKSVKQAKSLKDASEFIPMVAWMGL